MHTNENIAIGLFKESMIKIVLEKNPKKRVKKLEDVQKEMERYVLPIRELPGKERKKNISNKYKNNQKTVFKKPIFLMQEKYGLFCGVSDYRL